MDLRKTALGIVMLGVAAVLSSQDFGRDLRLVAARMHGDDVLAAQAPS